MLVLYSSFTVKLLDKNVQALNFQFLILLFACSAYIVSSLSMLYRIFHNPLHPIYSELSNLYYHRRIERSVLGVVSLSSSLRFNTSQYSMFHTSYSQIMESSSLHDCRGCGAE